MFSAKMRVFAGVFVLCLSLPLISSGNNGVDLASRGAAAAPTPSAGEKKGFNDYKGITIGLATAEVRTKLGPPKDKADDMDLYIFSDNESAQFYYGPTRIVTAMMITYTGDLKNAPTAKDVFGEDVPAKSDGSIFKMERYPKAGYWISYNRSGGADTVVSIAFQKM